MYNRLNCFCNDCKYVEDCTKRKENPEIIWCKEFCKNDSSPKFELNQPMPKPDNQSNRVTRQGIGKNKNKGLS